LERLTAFFHVLFHFFFAGFDLLTLFGCQDGENLLVDRFAF
jgi:hypothetical protein